MRLVFHSSNIKKDDPILQVAVYDVVESGC
jgi:hypothetical protein